DEVLFEGVVRADPKVKYPLCLEGARACPPEDCGGVWGYADFVEAIQNPKDERHEELLEWVGGSFDPEEFDPVKATKGMRKGLPDWRSEAGWGQLQRGISFVGHNALTPVLDPTGCKGHSAARRSSPW